MGHYRGQDIPSVSDYSHWNEDAELMWYNENKYDMEHSDEWVEDDPYGWDDDYEQDYED